MPCGSPQQDMLRFKAYLRAIHNGDPLGPEAFHGFPQALKVDIDIRRGRRKYDFIAKLENLNNDMAFIAFKIGMTTPLGINNASAQEAHSHKHGKCGDIDLENEQLQMMLCDLYV